MHADVDHETVRDAEDRAWTMPLLAIISDPSTSDGDREEAFETLGALSDHRAVGPLRAMLEDRAVDAEWREAAGAVLRGIDHTEPRASIRSWWADGDAVLQRHALLCMWREDADVVLPVASDPEHPMHLAGVNSLSRGFEEAAYVPAMIQALEHRDADVREMAAEILFWNEPVAAEFPLLRAAHDDEADVACEALCALEYITTRRVLRALVDLRTELDDEDARDQADSSLEELIWTFERNAETAVATHADGGAGFRAWLEPVADLIEWPEVDPDEVVDEPAGPIDPKLGLVQVSEGEVVELLGDVDGSWRDRQARLRTVDWEAFGTHERERLTRRLVDHPDPDMAWYTGTALAAWGRIDDLLGLLGHQTFGVKKSAAYFLGEVEPSPAARDPLWNQMMRESGFAAVEALRSYCHHAPEAEVIERIEALIGNDPREGLRAHAVACLVDIGAPATGAVRRLLPLLGDAPGVTWGLHVALLGAVRKLGLPCPDLSALEFVDDVWVMESVFGLLATRGD